MPSALVLLANGTEEMEFTIVYDVLVRAGVSVVSALVGSSSDSNEVSARVATCSRGVRIVADRVLSSIAQHGDLTGSYEAIVVPGGVKGAEAMSKDPVAQRAIQQFAEGGKVVAAVCAGSTALHAAGVGRGGAITSHPSVKGQLESDYDYKDERVVVNSTGRIVTSRGPGTSFQFALKLVELLVGEDKAREVAGPMILPPGLVSGA